MDPIPVGDRTVNIASRPPLSPVSKSCHCGLPVRLRRPSFGGSGVNVQTVAPSPMTDQVQRRDPKFADCNSHGSFATTATDRCRIGALLCGTVSCRAQELPWWRSPQLLEHRNEGARILIAKIKCNRRHAAAFGKHLGGALDRKSKR